MQVTRVDTQFARALQVKVQDNFDNPVSGVSVNFTAPVSGASATLNGDVLTTLAVATNAAGLASVSAKANRISGEYAVTAVTPGVTPRIFNLINASGAAAAMLVVAGTPQGADINSAFATRLKVKVQDSFRNGISGTTVTFTPPANGASGSFGGSNAVASDANGYAESPIFTANAITGTYNIVATYNTFSAEFQLTNWLSCGTAHPFTVTAAEDDGSATICGTLSRALLQARGVTTISFNLPSGNSP